MVESLVDNLVLDIDVAVLAGKGRQLAESRVGEVKASSAVGVPVRVVTMGAALAAIADKEGNVGLLAVDGDDDALTAVLLTAGSSLEGKVAHGDEVVGVDVVERLGRGPVAHDGTEILVVEVGAAGLTLLDVIVVGTETLALEEGIGGGGTGGKGESSESAESELHGDYWEEREVLMRFGFGMMSCV